MALAYLLNGLRTSGSGVSKILTEAEPFPGRIDAQYTAHWRQIQSDRELVDLLAMLARSGGRSRFPGSRSGPHKTPCTGSTASSVTTSGRKPEAGGVSSTIASVFFCWKRRNDFRGSAPPQALNHCTGGWPMSRLRLVRPGHGIRSSTASRPRKEERGFLKLATLSAFREQLFAGRSWCEVQKGPELLLPLMLPRRVEEGSSEAGFEFDMEIEQRAFQSQPISSLPNP